MITIALIMPLSIVRWFSVSIFLTLSISAAIGGQLSHSALCPKIDPEGVFCKVVNLPAAKPPIIN